MKHILLICSLLLMTGSTVFAQWSEEELAPYKRKANKVAANFTTHKIQSGDWDLKYDSLEIAFVTDTMRIEKVCQLLEDDQRYSTMEMHFTLSFMLEEYDKLLNRYYQYLMKQLSAGDKIKYREAQRIWLKYRDSEKLINSEIVAINPYTGGGTMWPIIAGQRNLNILKERLFSIYHLIKCI